MPWNSKRLWIFIFWRLATSPPTTTCDLHSQWKHYIHCKAKKAQDNITDNTTYALKSHISVGNNNCFNKCSPCPTIHSRPWNKGQDQIKASDLNQFFTSVLERLKVKRLPFANFSPHPFHHVSYQARRYWSNQHHTARNLCVCPSCQQPTWEVTVTLSRPQFRNTWTTSMFALATKHLHLL